MEEITKMDKDFSNYLNDIEITETNLQERIYNIFIFYANDLCPEDIKDIFVTDYISEELREYENLWFFSENFAMEAKNFISEDDFDITYFSKINGLEIKKKNYNFKNSNISSRLNLFCDTESEIYQMKASKNNCDYLKKIIKNYFLPRLK
jgi:hypothetical protein